MGFFCTLSNTYCSCQNNKHFSLILYSRTNTALESVVEWLGYSDYDRHDLSSKPFRAILLCRWTRHCTVDGFGKQF